MTKTQKRFIGDVGEELSCRFLKKRGFKILERNYLKKWGEIDVVAQYKDILHFVEVKTVQGRVSRETLRDNVSRETTKSNVSRETSNYRPEENVHPAKLKRLHRAVETYLLERKVSPETYWQIDVVTVRLDLKDKQAKVDVVENVIL